MNRQDIFTISAFNITTDEDVTPMSLCHSYYIADEAISEAIDYADDLSYEDDIIEVRVYAGEYENIDTGDVFGEPFDIFTATNTTKEKSAAARKAANYVNIDGLDYYAVKN